MEATLTWLDLTASDRDKMRRVLDLFNEQGTLDEPQGCILVVDEVQKFPVIDVSRAAGK